ncbi:hypothetical protein [uncultured Devosia sp.]|uniref:hypothetical protein n=1 Tax=uncultured Devosia sp. TaxID=211434 RepID=UPI0035CAA9FF
MNSQLTSEAARRFARLPQTNAPLRLAARQMRWFRAAFASYVRQSGEELGGAFEIDHTRLGTAFVSWLRALERERPRTGEGRREFLDFAASLMLQELIKTMPIRLSGAVGVRSDAGAMFWPEGFVLTHFCLLVHDAVIAQEYSENATVSPKIDQAGFWWTYRENATEDYRLSAAFFQSLLGYQPDWNAPSHYRHLRSLNPAFSH